MSSITEMQYAVEQIRTQLANICRPATVSYVYRKAGEDGIKADRDPGDDFIGYVDVESGEVEVWRVPVLSFHNGDDTSVWLPTEGETGYLFSPSGDLAQAFFVTGAPTENKPLPPPDGQATHSIVRDMREGNSEKLIIKDDSGAVVNQYTLDIGETDDGFIKLIFGDSEVQLNKDELESKHTDSNSIKIDKSETVLDRSGNAIKIDGSETKTERAGGTVRGEVGTSYHELTNILANIIGAHFFPTGITTLQSPVGPVLFAPAASPTAAPSPPAGSAPDGDGNVTQTPASSITGVSVQATSTLSLTLPAIPVLVGTSAGATTAGTYSATVTGTINLQFPARSL